MIMKRTVVFASLFSACVVGGAMFFRSSPPATQLQSSTISSLNAQLQTPGSQQESKVPPVPPPPPPPSPADPPFVGHRHDPARALIGTTEETIKQVEEYLPASAQIYTYPIDEGHLAAALISADLDGDGTAEAVVVYTERRPTAQEGSLPLTLSVLTRSGNRLNARASTHLDGEIFFSPRIEGIGPPLSVLDVTGDKRPEIIVVSGAGASLGGALQVFSLDSTTLREIANIGGHLFKVRSRGIGKPSTITARSNGEKEIRAFEWDGQVFEQVRRPKTR